MNIFDWGMNQTFNIYYDECCKILDVDKYHSSSALKKAYHKKVFESHPDKGGSTQDFIKVNEAYKFLSSLIIDKPQYSKCKEFIPNEKLNNSKNIKIKKDINFPKKEIPNQNNNEKDKDKDKEKNSNLNKNKSSRSKNINYKLDIELSDAYYGARKIIKLNRNRICKTCSEKNLLDMVNINCEECGGKKYSTQIKEVQLIIKPGTYNGCKVTFKGEGEEYPGIEPGDIIFDINTKENKNFLRKGSDLYIYKALSISEFLGMENILINLFGKTKFYANKNKIVINPGEVKTIIGKGFPFFDDNNHRGNLHIKFNISFPLNLKLEQKKIIKNVLEGNYMQYLKNINSTTENNSNNKKTLNKNNFKKTTTNNLNNNNYKPIKKSKFIPKFNIKKESNNQKEKIKNKNTSNTFKRPRSKSELNKSFNKKSQVNNSNINEKEKDLKRLEIYELVKFDESLVNKSYFYQKSNKNN